MYEPNSRLYADNLHIASLQEIIFCLPLCFFEIEFNSQKRNYR